MCGIIGLINLSKDEDKKVLQRKIFTNLLRVSQVRGTDATGVATLIKGKLHNAKSPECASIFTASRLYNQFEFGDMVIGHTRAKTQGEASNNENNHPFLTNRLALVHNGIIYNDSEVTEAEKLKLTGECDSEVIAKLTDKFWESGIVQSIKKTVGKLTGSMAVLMLDRKGRMYLFKDGNPIYLAYVPSLEAIFVASQENFFSQVFNVSEKWLGLLWGNNESKIKYQVAKLEDEDGLVFEFGKKNLIHKAFAVQKKAYRTVGYTTTTKSLGAYTPHRSYGHQSSFEDKAIKKHNKWSSERKPIGYNPKSSTRNTTEVRRFLNKHKLPRRFDWYDDLAQDYLTLAEAELDLATLTIRADYENAYPSKVRYENGKLSIADVADSFGERD